MITSIWTGPGGDASVARRLRQEVFCGELGLPEDLSWDVSDPYAWHLVLLMEEEPVAAGRITYGGVGLGKLGRICVRKRWRNQGIGDGLVKVLDYKASQLGMGFSQVEVPEELAHFYTRLGYRPCGDSYEAYGRTITPMKKETNDGSGENCAHQ